MVPEESSFLDLPAKAYLAKPLAAFGKTFVRRSGTRRGTAKRGPEKVKRGRRWGSAKAKCGYRWNTGKRSAVLNFYPYRTRISSYI